MRSTDRLASRPARRDTTRRASPCVRAPVLRADRAASGLRTARSSSHARATLRRTRPASSRPAGCEARTRSPRDPPAPPAPGLDTHATPRARPRKRRAAALLRARARSVRVTRPPRGSSSVEGQFTCWLLPASGGGPVARPSQVVLAALGARMVIDLPITTPTSIPSPRTTVVASCTATRVMVLPRRDPAQRGNRARHEHGRWRIAIHGVRLIGDQRSVHGAEQLDPITGQEGLLADDVVREQRPRFGIAGSGRIERAEQVLEAGRLEIAELG